MVKTWEMPLDPVNKLTLFKLLERGLQTSNPRSNRPQLSLSPRPWAPRVHRSVPFCILSTQCMLAATSRALATQAVPMLYQELHPNPVKSGH